MYRYSTHQNTYYDSEITKGVKQSILSYDNQLRVLYDKYTHQYELWRIMNNQCKDMRWYREDISENEIWNTHIMICKLGYNLDYRILPELWHADRMRTHGGAKQYMAYLKEIEKERLTKLDIRQEETIKDGYEELMDLSKERIYNYAKK